MNAEQMRERIAAELEKIAFADFSSAAKVLDTEENADFVNRLARLEKYFPAISSVKSVKDGVEVKFYDKLKALELLGKYAALREGAAEGDFDNLISVISSRTEDIWKGGGND